MFKISKLLLVAVFLTTGCFSEAQQGVDRQERARKMLATPNPIEASDSVWIEELTYMEVRDRIAEGYSTAIISTGGIEENGPYLATGKHNVILRSVCPAIARELGNTLCAPVVGFVPEGNLDPPSGAMLFPGSITVRDETYHALLVDIADSLRVNGFKDIVMIGDSGGNQRGMKAVAEELNERWAETGATAHAVIEFYTPGWEETEKYTEEELGVKEGESDGHHDDIWVTAMMMVSDPNSVRYHERVEANLASINGIDIAPMEEAIELGKKMVDFRAKYTADVIREKMALINQTSIQTTGFFLIGIPGETLDEMRRTVRLARELGLDRIQFNNFMPLPGSGVAANTAINVTKNDLCVGMLFFPIRGGVQPGRWKLILEFVETEAVVPFVLEID